MHRDRIEDSPGVREFGVSRYSSAGLTAKEIDQLAVEEPLEIVLRFRRRGLLVRKPVSVTMRTPGQDLELAVGFLFTEGILHQKGTIENLEHAPDSSVIVTVNTDVDVKRLERHFYTSSSCGVCGKTSLQALQINREIRLDPSRPTHPLGFLVRIPGIVREKQSIFDRIGRHNAVDKLIGAELLDGRTDFGDLMLFVSGRAGFELVQKSISAGIPFMAAVGAPSSLSVELAREYGSTLIGFLRENRFNLYSGFSRVRDAVDASLPGTGSG